VLYAGADEYAAFIETFGHDTGIRVVDGTMLRARMLAWIDVARPLVLVDLTGPGLAKLGADARLFAGEYDIARQWALALFRHPSRPDGIYYPSRHDPARACVAIFDRAQESVSAVALGRLIDPAHAGLLEGFLSMYDFGLTDP
jgi:hypothetical protein